MKLQAGITKYSRAPVSTDSESAVYRGPNQKKKKKGKLKK
jgi:hypothetical protein